MNNEHWNTAPSQMAYRKQAKPAPTTKHWILQTTYQHSSLTRREVQDDRNDFDLLKDWKQVCRKEFSWRPSFGDTVTVRSGKHKSPAAAKAEAREMALEMGYKPPRIFEFWRWGEEPLP